MQIVHDINTKSQEFQTSLVQITPNKAYEWFSSDNDSNRHLSGRAVDTLSAAMLRGEWQKTHQGVAFFKDGTIADGQHRLAAIVKSGKSITMLVTVGLDQIAASAMDAGRKRSKTDRIKCSGLSDWIESRHTQIMEVILSPKRPDVNELVGFMEPLKEHLQWAADQFRSNHKGVCNASIRAAVAMAHRQYECDPKCIAKLADFCDVFRTGVTTGLKKEAAIIALRDYYLHHQGGGGSIVQAKYRYAQKVISGMIEGTHISKKVPETALWQL